MNDFHDPRLWVASAAVCALLLTIFTAERGEMGNALGAALILALLLIALWLLWHPA